MGFIRFIGFIGLIGLIGFIGFRLLGGSELQDRQRYIP